MFFSSLHDKNFETDEKNYCTIDESITLLYDPSVGVITNMIGNIKCIFLFLKFLKNCVWSPYFLSDPQ